MFLLKFLAVVCLFAQVALSKKLPDNITEAWKTIIEPYHDLCWHDANPNQDDLDIMYNESQIQNSEKLGCYFKCLYRKLNLMKADGSWDVELMKTTFLHCKPEVLERCSNDAGQTVGLCKKAIHFADCVVREF